MTLGKILDLSDSNPCTSLWDWGVDLMRAAGKQLLYTELSLAPGPSEAWVFSGSSWPQINVESANI